MPVKRLFTQPSVLFIDSFKFSNEKNLHKYY